MPGSHSPHGRRECARPDLVSTPGDQMTNPPQGYVTTTPPKSPRAANFSDLTFLPGIASNAPSSDLKNRYIGSNRVRFHMGCPETIGGWQAQTLTGANGGVYIGTCRAT